MARREEEADIIIALEEEGAKFCIEITSSDKREKISITKQHRFYYMGKESEEYWKGDLSTLLSIHCLITSEKCGRKVESRTIPMLYCILRKIMFHY